MLLGLNQRIGLEMHVARIMCVRNAYRTLVATVEGQKTSVGSAGHRSEVTDEKERGSVACCGVEQGSVR